MQYNKQIWADPTLAWAVCTHQMYAGMIYLPSVHDLASLQAAMACGITPEEIRGMIDQAEIDKKEKKLGWYPTIASMEKKDPTRV